MEIKPGLLFKCVVGEYDHYYLVLNETKCLHLRFGPSDPEKGFRNVETFDQQEIWERIFLQSIKDGLSDWSIIP